MLCAERKVSPILSPRQPFLLLLLLYAWTFTCVENNKQVFDGDKR